MPLYGHGKQMPVVTSLYTGLKRCQFVLFDLKIRITILVKGYEDVLRGWWILYLAQSSLQVNPYLITWLFRVWVTPYWCSFSLARRLQSYFERRVLQNKEFTMAMSGVKLTEGCMNTYQDIQKSKKHRYAVFVIREGQIDVETVR